MKNTIYYSRSANEAGECETVDHHLDRVRALCGENAAAFHMEKLGELMGGMHDFGKYSASFQRVLAGTEQRVNHAAPGAAALLLYARKRGWSGAAVQMLAAAVHAHHGHLDLPRCQEDVRSCCKGDPRRDGEEKTYALCGMEELERQLPLLHLPVWADGLDPGFPELTGKGAQMLFARMMLSCLSDGDYSAAAEHFDPDYLTETTFPPLHTAEARQRLEHYRSAVKRRASASAGIADLRETVYRQCTDMGRSKSGSFTLTAPTGAGKTLAMLSFALEQMEHCGKQRIIVVLPFLTLTDQSADVYRHIIPDLLEDHSQAELDEEARQFAARWSARMIVTTSVRFFEGLFSDGAADLRRLHHIADSVILFDEAQTLPPQLIDATMEAVNLLCGQYHCTVLFSTATQPAFQYRRHVRWQPQEIMDAPAELFRQARRVRVDWRLDRPTPLAEVAARMAEQDSVCAIVNRKDHARELYRLLAKRSGAGDVFYMTTELCPAHRRAILRQIRERRERGLVCRLVATQCIEAGVDLSFDCLYRALAPLEGIIQAAGRCNRGGTAGAGRVTVFVPDGERLYPDGFYEYAANKVRLVAERHPIDIYDLSHIEEYYRELYTDYNGRQDKESLRRAIENLQFSEVARQYRIVEQRAVQVIVPYCGSIDTPGGPESAMDRYESIWQEAKANGLTPAGMKRAAPITVSVYDQKWAEHCCIPLPLRIRGKPAAGYGWYLLGDPSLYDSERTGIRPSSGSSLIF